MNITHKWQKQFRDELEGQDALSLLHLYGNIHMANLNLEEVAKLMWKARYIQEILEPLLEKGNTAFLKGKEEGAAQGYKEGFNYWINYIPQNER